MVQLGTCNNIGQTFVKTCTETSILSAKWFMANKAQEGQWHAKALLLFLYRLKICFRIWYKITQNVYFVFSNLNAAPWWGCFFKHCTKGQKTVKPQRKLLWMVIVTLCQKTSNNSRAHFRLPISHFPRMTICSTCSKTTAITLIFASVLPIKVLPFQLKELWEVSHAAN